MRVLFWGTPEFALPTLRALLGESHDVVGVVTQPDRPAGRGRGVKASPVKQLALEEGIPVLQPEKARGDEFLAQLRELDPEISVVVAYGQILSTEVLDFPKFGSVNLHASLLPELRGAAPINWAIARGYKLTGVTIMRMAKQLDAGAILNQVEEPIAIEENATDLTTRLSELGAEALLETLAMIEFDSVDEVEQDHSKATYAPKLTRENAHIDWNRTAEEIAQHIRAFDEVPGAWSTWRDDDVKLFRPLAIESEHDAAPGTVIEVSPLRDEEGFLVACGSGAVRIREVTIPGKRRMNASEWLRGRGAAVGDLFK